jgi:hypothetical protein
MIKTWKVRVRDSAAKPFKYHAAFVWDEPGANLAPLPPADLYAEGDLAAYLEDCGADLKDIAVLLDRLETETDAEILVRPPGEQIEVFWRS